MRTSTSCHPGVSNIWDMKCKSEIFSVTTVPSQTIMQTPIQRIKKNPIYLKLQQVKSLFKTYVSINSKGCFHNNIEEGKQLKQYGNCQFKNKMYCICGMSYRKQKNWICQNKISIFLRTSQPQKITKVYFWPIDLLLHYTHMVMFHPWTLTNWQQFKNNYYIFISLWQTSFYFIFFLGCVFF